MAAQSAWKPREIIRWGIIGCGDVTEVKSGPGFQKAAGSQLTAVMRRNSQKAEDYARRHNVPKWYSNADALIADPEVDAVYVATPPGSHLEFALRVCAAGKPAYIEKPMARNGAECDRMVDAFAKAKLPLFVAYYRRAMPRFVKAEALIDEGVLGRLSSVRYHYNEARHRTLKSGELPWRLDVEQAGGGLFLDLGSHTLDLLDFFLGPLENVTGSASNVASPYDVEDTLAMSFRTDSGAPGVASWNFAASAQEDVFIFTGTEGRLTFSTFGTEPLLLETSEGRREFLFTPPQHVAQPLIQTVMDDLRGIAPCPGTGESARRTSHVMDKVLESYYGGRSDAFWLRRESWPGQRAK